MEDIKISTMLINLYIIYTKQVEVFGLQLIVRHNRFTMHSNLLFADTWILFKKKVVIKETHSDNFTYKCDVIKFTSFEKHFTVRHPLSASMP
jgi:hypothetical protein